MKNQSNFIWLVVALATSLTLAACHKQVGAYEADGSTTTQTKAPVAGTASDLSAKGTVPGASSGVAAQGAAHPDDVSDLANHSTNRSDTTAVKSGTSAEINHFNSATTGGQNTSGTTSGARSAGHTSSGTSNADGTSSSDSRNKGSGH